MNASELLSVHIVRCTKVKACQGTMWMQGTKYLLYGVHIPVGCVCMMQNIGTCSLPVRCSMFHMLQDCLLYLEVGFYNHTSMC